MILIKLPGEIFVTDDMLLDAKLVTAGVDDKIHGLVSAHLNGTIDTPL